MCIHTYTYTCINKSDVRIVILAPGPQALCPEHIRVYMCTCYFTLASDITMCSLQHKTVPLRLTFSPNGKLFAVMAKDRKVGAERCREGGVIQRRSYLPL